VVAADHPHADLAVAPADVVVVDDALVRVVLGAGGAVRLAADVLGLDQGVGAGVPGVGVVVGEQSGLDADDVAGGGDGGVRLVRPHVDVVLAAAGGVVVVHRAVDDGDQDGVAGPADAHRRGAQAGLDV
jgi:hypothetical protein